MSAEDRTTDIGNMHKKIGKDRECGSEDIRADRQTDPYRHSSQYFATVPGGEVMILQTRRTFMAALWNTSGHYIFAL